MIEKARLTVGNGIRHLKRRATGRKRERQEGWEGRRERGGKRGKTGRRETGRKGRKEAPFSYLCGSDPEGYFQLACL